MYKKLLWAIALLMTGCASQPKQELYEKQVTFPTDATLEQKVDMASRLVPTPQQLEWQQMEFTAFLHFGINTFTGREWGDGTESPQLVWNIKQGPHIVRALLLHMYYANGFSVG